MGPFDSVEDTFEALARRLNEMGIAYIHTVDHSSMGAPVVPDSMKSKIRTAFTGAIVLSGGYDQVRAEADIDAGKGDLVAFARAFLANPDLVLRMRQKATVNMPASMDLLYTPGPEGYTDYPTLNAAG
jgi:N-ethylmaleimide reductase